MGCVTASLFFWLFLYLVSLGFLPVWWPQGTQISCVAAGFQEGSQHVEVEAADVRLSLGRGPAFLLPTCHYHKPRGAQTRREGNSPHLLVGRATNLCGHRPSTETRAQGKDPGCAGGASAGATNWKITIIHRKSKPDEGPSSQGWFCEQINTKEGHQRCFIICKLC